MTAASRSLSLQEVLRLSREDAERRFGCRLLDLRAGEKPPTDHLPGSAWVPTPKGEPHASLLPARGARLVVLHDDPETAQQAAQRLRERGWPADALAAPLSNLLLAPGPPTGAAWAPDPYLAEQCERFDSAAPGRVVDLGCGSGRDAVFLAARGLRILGIDRLPDALDLARDRARLLGVEVDFRRGTLRDAEDLPDDLPEEPFAAAVCIRFWKPELLAGLHRRVRPGGLLVLRAYGPGSPSGGGQGPRRPGHRARREQLEEILADHWEWIDGPRERAPEEGGWIEVVARRRPPTAT